MANGYIINKIYKEIASGLNDNRKQLNEILKSDKITKIVIEHKDRLTRFGFNYIKELLKQKNCKIEIVNETMKDEDDLMQDFVSIVTSMCARLYGKRRNKRTTEKIIRSLNNNEEENKSN